MWWLYICTFIEGLELFGPLRQSGLTLEGKVEGGLALSCNEVAVLFGSGDGDLPVGVTWNLLPVFEEAEEISSITSGDSKATDSSVVNRVLAEEWLSASRDWRQVFSWHASFEVFFS